MLYKELESRLDTASKANHALQCELRSQIDEVARLRAKLESVEQPEKHLSTLQDKTEQTLAQQLKDLASLPAASADTKQMERLKQLNQQHVDAIEQLRARFSKYLQQAQQQQLASASRQEQLMQKRLSSLPQPADGSATLSQQTQQKEDTLQQKRQPSSYYAPDFIQTRQASASTTVPPLMLPSPTRTAASSVVEPPSGCPLSLRPVFDLLSAQLTGHLEELRRFKPPSQDPIRKLEDAQVRKESWFVCTYSARLLSSTNLAFALSICFAPR